MQESGTAVVVGASALGEGIAADLVNAGWTVHFLDASLEQVGKSLARLRAARPPLLFLPELLARIQPGTLNDLTRCREADWVIEALPDSLELKRRLLLRLEVFVGPKTVTSTTTTLLSHRDLLVGCEPRFCQRFLGTHFFAPPRYHKLVELIAGEEVAPALVAELAGLLETSLGHRVVLAHDTPGFVATRLWITHLMDALHTALELGLEVEQVDALTGVALGRPQGLFRALDQAGLDYVVALATQLHEALPADPLRGRLLPPALLKELVAQRAVGDRVGRGFYRREGGQWQALDLATRAYRPLKTTPTDAGEGYQEQILETLFAQARRVQPLLTESERALDQALEWGYGWKKGPFALEAERHGRLFAVPSPRPEYLELSHWPVVEQTEAALLRDLGDGILGVSFQTPQNALTPALFEALVHAVERAESEFHALLLANVGPNFCSGFARDRWWHAIERSDFAAIDTDIQRAQLTFMRLQQAKVPVVAVVAGFTLGGGAELALHCRARHASPETYLGFPQITAGLLPCFGGMTALLTQLQDPRATLMTVLGGQVSSSAWEAQQAGRLAPSDTISRNADRLLQEARLRALALTEVPAPELPALLPRGDGAALRAELEELQSSGRITAHELRLAEAAVFVLCDGPMDPSALRAREREACLALCRDPLSQARLRHLVETGTPLRN